MQPMPHPAKSAISKKFFIGRRKYNIIVHPIYINKDGNGCHQPGNDGTHQMPAQFLNVIEEAHFCRLFLAPACNSGKE